MKKFFTNDKVFLATAIIAVLGIVFFCIGGIIGYPDSIVTFVLQLIAAGCSLCAYISYRSHNKNVMKGMMGAILMAILASAISSVKTTIYEIDEICAPISLILCALLFINHFVINSDRKSSPLNISLNQFLSLLFAFNYLIWNIISAIQADNVYACVSSVIIAISMPCLIISIVCIESRLDAYRTDREEAGWNEEAGYPEGYKRPSKKK